MKITEFKLVAVLLASTSIVAAADKPPRYTILKVKTAPKIDGRLDEAAIFDRALTPDEIRTLAH